MITYQCTLQDLTGWFNLVLWWLTLRGPQLCLNEDEETAKNLRYDSSLRKQSERQAVHRYLQGKQCHRTSLTEHLDIAEHRLWCMTEDVTCDFCPSSHVEPISSPERAPKSKQYTSLGAIQREKLQAHDKLARYREHLFAVRGTCLLRYSTLECVAFPEFRLLRTRCPERVAISTWSQLHACCEAETRRDATLVEMRREVCSVCDRSAGSHTFASIACLDILPRPPRNEPEWLCGRSLISSVDSTVLARLTHWLPARYLQWSM